ncbi:MAG: DUF4625 domain-containing protein [Bacteroidetes bacterium]|nr:MAG: DUF4625 domain-containing protein [Bacteroidota bacterium]
MRLLKFSIPGILLLAFFAACVKEDDKEILPPEIEIISPWHCDTIYFDEPVTYRFKITDKSKVGLGNFSMDIHNNFNHHSHGSHASCAMDPQKNPVHPWEEVWIVNLPDDEFEYLLEMEINMPLMKDDTHEHDQGDYHFHIYITNAEGYQTFTSLDVKLLKREE